MLDKMTPRPTPFDVVNDVRADATCSCDVNGLLAFQKLFANLVHVFFSYCRVGMTGTKPGKVSSLFHFVRNVDLVVPREKMVRIAARRVIASVKYMSSRGRFSLGQFEGNNMGSEVLSVQPESSVSSVLSKQSCPFPTLVLFSFRYMRPKSVEKTKEELSAFGGDQSFGKWIHTRLPLNVICS